MIGVPGQDARRAIKLLGEHDPDQEMRPGHGAEGHAILGIVPQRPEPVRATNQEGGRWHPAITQLGKMGRECLAGQGAARRIERDAMRAVGDRGGKRLALLCRGLASALYLMQAPGRETEPGGQRLEAAGIVFVQ